MNAYRPLSVREIAVLQQQGCRADDWSHIQVKDGFTPEAVEQVRFYGPVRLGVFHRTLEPEPGIHRPSGIRQAELHDVTVGDDCLIAPGAYISRVGTMSMEPSATCGLGTPVNVLSEADAAFRVWLHRRLGAQEFYLRSRLSSSGCRALDAWVKAEVEASIPSRGVVGADACIVGVSRLRNVYVGASAVIDGVRLIENQLISLLANKYDVKAFDSVGEIFDPERHEAVALGEPSETDEQIVLTEYQKGYTWGDAVLRTAKVVVSAPSDKTEKTE